MSEAVRVVAAPAEIDPATVQALVDDLDRLPDHVAIDVDCSNVAFMDSAGVRALSMAAQRQAAGGGTLRVVRPTEVVRRVLEVTALDGLIRDEPADGDAPGAPVG